MKNIFQSIAYRTNLFFDKNYYLHKWLKEHPSNSIETMVIEMSSFCNLQCEFCNFHGKEKLLRQERRESFMSWDIAKKIADQAKRIETLKQIISYHSGEELLNPEWYEMLSYILDELGGVERLNFSTNGMLLDEENISKIQKLNAKHIRLSISFTGHSRDEVELLRKGISYEKVKDNILKTKKYFDDKIKILITIDYALNRDEVIKHHGIIDNIRCDVPDYIKEDFKGIQCVCGPTCLYNPQVSYDFDKFGLTMEKVSSKRSSCINVFNLICIDSQGYVLNCACNGGYERIGNILDNDMTDIWENSVSLREARKLIREQEKSPDFCKNCPFQNGGGEFYILTK